MSRVPIFRSLALSSPAVAVAAAEQGGEGRKLLEWWSGVEREGRVE
jgi:hypothetical protein